MNPYTKRKFLSFPLKSQHKKCAELLRQFYRNSALEVLNAYNEIQEWMRLKPLTEGSGIEEACDRYHWHLNAAGIHLTEPSLLPRMRCGDRERPAAFKLAVSIYLEKIRSAHNVGSMLRTVEAFHLGDVYFSAETPTEKHPQVKKTAMGCAEGLSCHHAALVESLPRPLIALETCSGAAPIDQFTFPYPCCLAFGNEEYGLSEKVLAAADAVVEIPLYGRKNSLNVANAFAIAAAAVSQQLRGKECHAPS